MSSTLSKARRKQKVSNSPYSSPVRPRNKEKTAKVVYERDIERRDRLQAKLNALLQTSVPLAVPSSTDPNDGDQWMDIDPADNLLAEIVEAPPLDQPDQPQEPVQDSGPTVVNVGSPSKRRILPNAADYRLYHEWMNIIPTLVDDYIHYANITMGKPPGPSPEEIFREGCVCHDEKLKVVTLTCLYVDYYRIVKVYGCLCSPLHRQLVKNGLFPAAPSQPNIAVSLELLGLYRALFERSCDAVNALAQALHTHYTRRGFHIVNNKGDFVQDPHRRALANAVQWHDNLQIQVQKRVDAAVDEAAASIKASKAGTTADSPDGSGQRTEASRLLQSRCPACFSRRKWGTSFNEGGDFHASTDGNFHHRHQTSSGDGPYFYDPLYFLSKEEVDRVGERIEAARKKTPHTYVSKVPQEAIDECEGSHAAANSNKQKTDMGHFDDTGIAALVCRHGIPIFMANIDTPGEQQKYAIALIERVFAELPPEATGMFLYDVGCVLDISVHKFDILPQGILERVMFATTAMHAYAHQWSCQLWYNPRLKPGLALSDGEGVERLWSRLRRLIGITRTSGRRRRLWLLDRQLHFIASDMRDDLDDWIRRKLSGKLGVVQQTVESQKTLDSCAIPEEELREQWSMQIKAQTSLRAHAPQRLRKQVDTVLALQEDVAAVQVKIDDARSTLAEAGASRGSKQSLKTLCNHQEKLLAGVDALYASLNVHEQFPELEGVDAEFVRTLLLARDLKINIRKRAIGSFLEWEKLDQAVGGKHQALGTKMHQRTRAAITKRTPALMRAIRTFNKYCAKLSDLHDPSWSIPVPAPLPTFLADLRDRSDLLEDVWISRREAITPRWLAEFNVRDGIRALLKKDRCLEERRRLGDEADGLCRWLGAELAAVELALRSPLYTSLHTLLNEKRRGLLFLEKRWTTPLASDLRFRSTVQEAAKTAQALSGAGSATELDWMPPNLATPSILPETSADDVLALPDDYTYSFGNALAPDSDNLAAEDNLDDNEDVSRADEVVNKASAVISWQLPDRLNLDPMVDYDTNSGNPPALRDIRPRLLCLVPPRRNCSFVPADIARFISPTALLNDECVNGGALLLQTQLLRQAEENGLQGPQAQSVAILTTHDLVRIRYGASDDDVWRNVKRVEYWSKSVWVLPIHRQDAHHWVVCVIYPQHKQLHLFDSFADRRAWHADIKDIMCLVARLSVLAGRNGHSCIQDDFTEWSAYPLSLQAVQTNGYDCGVWVLAVILSVLQGYSTSSMREKHIEPLRRCILNLVLQLEQG
ncbi:hypothetical protein HWV62_3356 [Athelia sp. TMB]|nr:hypothetical protein HWV62_3356 [Athelia sp. TMB]